MTKRPSPSGLEVRPPVDLAAEVGRPRSEEVETVSEDSIGPLDDVLACIELEASDRRHGRQDRTAQRADRIEASQRRRYLFRLRAERSSFQPRLTKSAAPEGGHAPEGGSRPRALPERETLAKPDSQPVGMRPATQ
jgi:hypothetical protein